MRCYSWFLEQLFLITAVLMIAISTIAFVFFGNLISYHGVALPFGIIATCGVFGLIASCVVAFERFANEEQNRCLMIFVGTFYFCCGLGCYIFMAYYASKDIHVGNMRLYMKDPWDKIMIDRTQMLFQCCGDNSYQDWFKVDWQGADIEPWGTYPPTGVLSRTAVPFSCCSPEAKSPCIHNYLQMDQGARLYRYGCKPVLVATATIFSFIIAAYLTITGALMVQWGYCCRDDSDNEDDYESKDYDYFKDDDSRYEVESRYVDEGDDEGETTWSEETCKGPITKVVMPPKSNFVQSPSSKSMNVPTLEPSQMTTRSQNSKSLIGFQGSIGTIVSNVSQGSSGSKTKEIAASKTSMGSKTKEMAASKTSVGSKTKEMAASKTSVGSKTKEIAASKTSVGSTKTMESVMNSGGLGSSQTLESQIAKSSKTSKISNMSDSETGAVDGSQSRALTSEPWREFETTSSDSETGEDYAPELSPSGLQQSLSNTSEVTDSASSHTNTDYESSQSEDEAPATDTESPSKISLQKKSSASIASITADVPASQQSLRKSPQGSPDKRSPMSNNSNPSVKLASCTHTESATLMTKQMSDTSIHSSAAYTDHEQKDAGNKKATSASEDGDQYTDGSHEEATEGDQEEVTDADNNDDHQSRYNVQH